MMQGLLIATQRYLTRAFAGYKHCFLALIDAHKSVLNEQFNRPTSVYVQGCICFCFCTVSDAVCMYHELIVLIVLIFCKSFHCMTCNMFVMGLSDHLMT